ncbi:hypothetical protein EQP59_00390 [Ornithobacterium rhinotracheale]|uniref:Uncharacterized protein n=1 Tax=Ornithobacterium rhinotracheale TaxID=28251 RepID=A0A3R6ASZ2_ORNRH|nr:hypothetical protein [Ornithobacterium rhinotracheale]MRJ07508.1 hypothetical protein [Ornithobacterium rhinotracheale]QAR29924.1 hypothetical protein EQP59_00390 [Ornithobacterium rhinotracheale]UOH78102.1 hypothetical protein MT996_01215 [Ornithobacterium rhinotracheale]
MKVKIIVICIDPYQKPVVNDLFFQDKFLMAGCDFEYWSLSDYFGCNYINEVDYFDHKVRYFNSIDDVVNALLREQDFYCDLQIPINKKTYIIYETAVKQSIKSYRINYLVGSLEVMLNKKSLFQKILYYINPIKFYRDLMHKLFLEKFKNSSTNKNLIKFTAPNKRNDSDNIINHIDYEKNLKIKKYETSTDYFLFIDQFLVGHPDFALRGYKNIDRKHYLECMNKFFNQLEKKFNKEVIISAHPKSDYNEYDFNNRKIIKFKTPELSKNALAVMTHFSTAFNFSILNYKPLFLLTMNEFYNKENKTNLNEYSKIAYNIAKYFDSPIINVNNDIEKITSDSFKIKKHIYDKYISEYLHSRNDNLTNFEIITKKLNINETFNCHPRI